MPRIARIVVPGEPHHITQRGNRRLPTFFQDDDYRQHVGRIRRSGREEVDVPRQGAWPYSAPIAR